MSGVLPPDPTGHPYYGPLLPETLIDGWCYGAITEFLEPHLPNGCESGDGFVVAPDGCYCGLVWSIDCPFEFEQIHGPRSERLWGVFEVRFARGIRCVWDLVENFRQHLPALRRSYELWRANNRPQV